MSVSLDTKTLVIGAGFAGLSVASTLDPAETIVVERGDPFDYSSEAARFLYKPVATNAAFARVPAIMQHRIDPLVMAEAERLVSPNRDNGVTLPLSRMSTNVYSYRAGGISNWWGGYSPRITQETFAQCGVIQWPISLETLVPFYEDAEALLRVHGDPVASGQKLYGAIPGHSLWKDYLADLFPQAHLTSEAKNITDDRHARMGTCQARGHCALCSNDAKARPETAFPNVSVFHATRVENLQFVGDRVVAAHCVSNGEAFDVTAERYVLAAGGLENVALLRRSLLPRTVPADLIGRRYQDHTAAELLVQLPMQVPYLAIGAEAHVEIPELSGYFRSIEIKTLLLTVPPSPEVFRAALPQILRAGYDLDGLNERAGRLARLYLQIEIPPEWELQLCSRGRDSFLNTLPYIAHMPVLHMAVLDVMARVRDAGLDIVAAYPHYAEFFGGHHYSGTTPMSRGAGAVIEPDHRLIGTTNLYISGASTIPRCGAAGPTLSLVAMGRRLGQLLGGRMT